jgi:hypothetical protein
LLTDLSKDLLGDQMNSPVLGSEVYLTLKPGRLKGKKMVELGKILKTQSIF